GSDSGVFSWRKQATARTFHECEPIQARRSGGIRAAAGGCDPRPRPDQGPDPRRRVLRQQINGLQGGLKKLSGGLEDLERKPRADSPKRVERPATASKPARTRKPKKVA